MWCLTSMFDIDGLLLMIAAWKLSNLGLFLTWSYCKIWVSIIIDLFSALYTLSISVWVDSNSITRGAKEVNIGRGSHFTSEFTIRYSETFQEYFVWVQWHSILVLIHIPNGNDFQKLTQHSFKTPLDHLDFRLKIAFLRYRIQHQLFRCPIFSNKTRLGDP